MAPSRMPEETELHELVAAYALNALDDDDRVAFEEHLADCEQCTAALADLRDTAAALAYVPETVAPPAALRSRILETARAERPNVVPLHRARATDVGARRGGRGRGRRRGRARRSGTSRSTTRSTTRARRTRRSSGSRAREGNLAVAELRKRGAVHVRDRQGTGGQDLRGVGDHGRQGGPCRRVPGQPALRGRPARAHRPAVAPPWP